MRPKMTNILPCDVHLSNPVHPNTQKEFEAIISLLILEPSYPNMESFMEAATNVVSLLKPGGQIIVMGSLEVNSTHVH